MKEKKITCPNCNKTGNYRTIPKYCAYCGINLQNNLKNQKENKDNGVKILNDLTDQKMATEIMELLMNKKIPISARRAEKILDIAKSMIPDLANIYYQ